MKLLLDENLPVKLKYRFEESGYEAYTVRDKNWFSYKNGELLKAMTKEHFDAFITIDNNLNFQQNFQNYPIKVIIIIALSNTYETIMEDFSSILQALNNPDVNPVTVVHPNHSAYKQ